jgi:glycosyltransferase involved in cell wall biosynthesis
MPLVSVVMLSYNNEKFTAEAIESVLGQDFDDFELIIVDDASTDSSRQIIQKYAAEDPRIRVILHKANCGIAKTANDGNDRATGDFLGCIASDDIWMKDKLSKQLAVLESNEDLIIWTEGEVIDERGTPMGKSFSELIGSVSEKKSGDVFRELLERTHVFGSTMLYKRVNQGDIRYDERLKYANDWKFELDLAAKYEFHYIAEPLAHYRIHADNTWGGKPPNLEKRLAYHQERIFVLKCALRQYRHRMSAETKATLLERLGFSYYELGQNRKALTDYLLAITHSPFRKSNLQYPRRFLQFMRNALSLELKERK